jgi:putative copper export protein
MARLMLMAHVVASVGWFGALLAFLVHAAAGTLSNDPQLVSAMALAMGVAAWYVILPLSVATVLSGIVQALGTAWGLLRHHWVVFKLLLTGIATIVLLLKLGPIEAQARAARAGEVASAAFMQTQTSLLLHSIGGTAVLLAAAVLAIAKPAGLTRWAGRVGPAPRWVKISAWLVGAAASSLVALWLSGHQPHGMHGA